MQEPHLPALLMVYSKKAKDQFYYFLHSKFLIPLDQGYTLALDPLTLNVTPYVSNYSYKLIYF